MRIAGEDSVNTISTPQTQSVFDLSKPATAGGRTEQTTNVSGDRIDLGSQNGLVSQAQTAGASERAARVEQLRALVQSGQYQVDANVLSQSLVSAALAGF